MPEPVKDVCQDIKQIVHDRVLGRPYKDLLDVMIVLNEMQYDVIKEMDDDTEV